MQKDRDQQIELVISKLSEETEELEKRAFEKYEKKLADVMSSKSSEFTSIQRKAKVLESQIEQLKLNIVSMENEKNNSDVKLKEIKISFSDKDDIIRKLEAEVAKLKSQTSVSDELIESLERNFSKRMERELEAGNKRVDVLRKEIEDLKNRHYKELDEASEKQAKELETMEERVRKIMDRKDKEIGRLMEEVKQKGLEIEKYIELLDKQRRDLLRN